MAHSSLLPYTVASAASDGTAKVWSGPQLAQLAHTLCPAQQAAVCGASFSSVDPHLLALACADSCGYVYDLRKAQEPLHVRPGLSYCLHKHHLRARMACAARALLHA